MKVRHESLSRGDGRPLEFELVLVTQCGVCNPANRGHLGVLHGAKLEEDGRGGWRVRTTDRTVTLHCTRCDNVFPVHAERIRDDGVLLPATP